MDVNVRKEDQILMSLVHYFVTKENYAPIYVHGVKDEIWLENLDGPYRVIRINSNRVFNDEQFKFDQYKINDILRQIKKKTMSFNVNALNINLNADERVDDNNGLKHIDNIKIKDIQDIEQNESILNIFPNIKNSLKKDASGLELIFNVTNDINEKTQNDNKRFERIFSPKKIFITYLIMFICIVYYLLLYLVGDGPSSYTLLKMGANESILLKAGQLWRLVSYGFLHGSVMHIMCNMYSLYVIGPQIESKFGKTRYIIIYLLSMIAGGLASSIFNINTISVGASGAIFGLLGAFLYFGLRFRLYFKESLRSSIIPVILLNLFIGFVIPGIDNYCHIGGLIAGFLAAMAVGIPEDNVTKDRVNGTILLMMVYAFFIYLAFFR